MKCILHTDSRLRTSVIHSWTSAYRKNVKLPDTTLKVGYKKSLIKAYAQLTWRCGGMKVVERARTVVGANERGALLRTGV